MMIVRTIVTTKKKKIWLCFLSTVAAAVAAALTPTILTNGVVVPTHRVLLHPNDPNSLYGLAVSSDYWYNHNYNDDNIERLNPSQQQQSKGGGGKGGNANFLATQVWPASRVACLALERLLLKAKQQQQKLLLPIQNKDDPSNMAIHNNDNDSRYSWTMCEFGCGPGLPSLVAAAAANLQDTTARTIFSKVIATDVDEMALQLVQTAAQEQQLSMFLETQMLDLSNPTIIIPKADLYVFSDVFETNAVARGAARVTHQILSSSSSSSSSLQPSKKNIPEQQQQECFPNTPMVWVFCQSDRVQRDVYVRELQQYLESPSSSDDDDSLLLSWQELSDMNLHQRLWLCNVDEMSVPYL